MDAEPVVSKMTIDFKMNHRYLSPLGLMCSAYCNPRFNNLLSHESNLSKQHRTEEFHRLVLLFSDAGVSIHTKHVRRGVTGEGLYVVEVILVVSFGGQFV